MLGTRALSCQECGADSACSACARGSQVALNGRPLVGALEHLQPVRPRIVVMASAAFTAPLRAHAGGQYFGFVQQTLPPGPSTTRQWALLLQPFSVGTQLSRKACGFFSTISRSGLYCSTATGFSCGADLWCCRISIPSRRT